jgi:hypothetical protein
MVSRAAQQPHQALFSITYTNINVIDVYIRDGIPRNIGQNQPFRWPP